MKWLAFIVMFSFSSVVCPNESKNSKVEFYQDFIKSELEEFARASCIGQFFKKHKYNTESTRSVTAAIVEMGSYAAVRYADVVNLVNNYKPKISTLHELDMDLFKCFVMMHDKKFMDALGEIKNKKYKMSDY